MQTFSLAELEIAPENPRQQVSVKYIESLANNISAQGLKQNLVGYIEIVGGSTSVVFITAGGCRLRALRKLLKDGELPPESYEVPVRIEDKSQAVKTALSENTVRMEMDPATRMRTYKKLRDEGMSEHEICIHYSVSKKAFSNTMRIADLPDAILDCLADGKMMIDHAAAYATGTEEKALALFNENKRPYTSDWNGLNPANIRRAMTDTKISQDDRLAKYVGRSAYEKAGGPITEDLFSEDVWLDDACILDNLAIEKLARASKRLGKGWSWNQHQLESPQYDDLKKFGRLYPELDDDHNETYTDAQKALSGVVVFINYEGKADSHAGLVRPADIPAAAAAFFDGSFPGIHQPEAGGENEDPLAYSAAMIVDLKIMHRTAMQIEMLEKPEALLNRLLDQLRGKTYTGVDLTGYPSTRMDDKLIEQGFMPNERLSAAWAGKTKAMKGKAGREHMLASEIAARLEYNADYDPKIRKVWNPNSAWFKRLTKPQLLAIACELGLGQIRKWDAMKKGDAVDLLHRVFENSIDLETDREIKQAAVKAAEAWLPPCLRPIEVMKPGSDVDSLPDDEGQPE